MSEKTAGTNKDVIYIDIDDEITGIIDKVRGSGSKIVALVLPKRATVLQSIVNMKLLKRSADEAKKKLVLITGEAGLMPLAGNVGVHVAKSLQSKPEIPDAPERGDSPAEHVDEDDDVIDDAPDPALDKTRPVGELAGAAAMDDTIELDDDDESDADGTPAAAAVGTAAKKGAGKKLKIPNFNRFRLLLILGGLGVVALVVLAYICFAVLPKASISIKTDSQSVNSSTVITLNTAADAKLDVAAAAVPAKSQVVQKTLSQEAAATGQQNNGEYATGTVSIKNCSSDPVTLPAGTAVTSSGLTFITQTTLLLDSGNFTSGGTCKSSGSHVDTVGVKAQKPGTAYNIGPSTFAVPGKSGVTGSSSAKMAGGTDNITKIVMQADIDSATQKISSSDTSGIKEELKTDLTNLGYVAVLETFSTGTPETKTSVNAGDKADSVTVTQTIKYTMLGVKQDDIKQIIAADIKKKIDTKKQSILDYGLDSIVFGVQSQSADSGATLTMQTNVVAGPDLHVDDIKKQVAGKKAGDAKETIKENPGVTEVEVHYSPFWVSSIPKKTSRITVTIEKPKAASTNSSSNANGH